MVMSSTLIYYYIDIDSGDVATEGEEEMIWWEGRSRNGGKKERQSNYGIKLIKLIMFWRGRERATGETVSNRDEKCEREFNF